MSNQILRNVFCYFLAVSLASSLSACFFAPNMNLPDHKQVSRVSQINNIDIYMMPIDQLSVESNYATMKEDPYRIGIHDSISLSIWGHPEISTANISDNINPVYYDHAGLPLKQVDFAYGLSKPNENKSDIFTVDDKGNVYLPMVGTIHVAGQTIADARNKLALAYKDYIVNPNVNLKIASYRSQKIFVIGEVQLNQVLPITDSPISLTLALQTAGWVNPNTSNVKEIYVLRQRDRNSVFAFMLDARSAAAMLYAQRFILKDNDIVYVPATGFSQFSRVMTQLLPTAETIWYTENSMPSSIVGGVLN